MFFLLLILLFSDSSINTNYNCLLDPTFLTDCKKTQKRLLERGFKSSCFYTKDHIKLCGLLLDQHKKHIPCATIIYCAGFYPGTKEGMSSFYTLLEHHPYNIFLFDARGHNESEGKFLTFNAIKKYGTVEYLDIVAAIEHLNTYNKEHNIPDNIVIHAICSGAYHTILALQYLKQHNAAAYQSVKGIIFDSGWFHLHDIIATTIDAELTKRLKNSYFSWIKKPLQTIIQWLYDLFLYESHRNQDGIYQTIATIDQPIWFIHCINDPYIPSHFIQRYVACNRCPYYWWINHDSHANYHMHNHKLYQEKLLTFLEQLNLHQ